MKNAIIVSLFVLSGVLGTAFGAPINLVVNGDFENPALSGNGTIYSTNPSFSLPGWTVPTGENQFHLEFGQPFGLQRYNDGQQAISLNCAGNPCSMSQTLNLIARDAYTLTFALAEERNFFGVDVFNPTTIGVDVFNPTTIGVDVFSPTTISVDIGSSSKSFNPSQSTQTNGYSIFSFDFIADSATTLLKFTDTTLSSDPINSLFIDSVSVTSTASGGGNLPVPVPEPATLSLLAVGFLLARMFSRWADKS